jgi:hypothetical protein
MRRIRSITTVAIVAVLALVASACGALADDTAATVAGRTVSISQVEDLARDEGFVGAAIERADQGRLSGDLFRSVLQFELQRVAWIAEADRWGLELTDDARVAARSEVESQTAAGGLSYSPSTTDAIVEYVAAQQVLEQRFSQIDPDGDDDLRRLYDGVPALWRRVCVAVAFVEPDAVDDARSALDGGATVEELPEAVPGSALAADPAEQCIPEEQLPEDLVDAFSAAESGENAGPVSVDDGMGGQSTYLFRVDDRRTLSFEDARDELSGIAGSLVEQGARPWISLIVASAEIDPRFGSGVTVGAEGQATIGAPPVPLAPAPEPPDMFGVPIDDGQ